ncbi:hypothetical protein ACW6AV_001679 [Edwardsiella piscicida]|uniref:hypothetical protein n=1 Tax=Edwardsiella piscicida TaxID=1263550 RepID=UPI00101AC854|nr:hypothetical protein [Edwardsiella piscicida]ELM3659781.1 hypothetical protein [Edwardsiella piscicida]QBB13894.1 hypothetical protein EVK84_15785 [Edwardsiella piscicida]
MIDKPYEKLNYDIGDKFVLLSPVGDLLTGIIVTAAKKGRVGGGLGIFNRSGRDFWLDPLNLSKLDGDGWIEWRGGEIPVDQGTLVDVKYRDGKDVVGVTAGIGMDEDGFEKKEGCARCATHWRHACKPADIVAYRLHRPAQPAEPEDRLASTLDDLLHAWQKAKANADTSRNILKLAEQEEAEARKALDDALRAAGYDKVCDGVPKEETLNITDWRDLKVGDIVWWSGGDNFEAGEYLVDYVDPSNSCDCCPFRVIAEGRFEPWVNIKTDQWRFIRRPA